MCMQQIDKCTITSIAPKIHSGLKHLDPSNTCEVELAILNNSDLKVVCLGGTDPSSGACFVNLTLTIEENLFQSAGNKIPEIEEHLKVKANSVLRYFPQCRLSEVKVLNKKCIGQFDFSVEDA